ncbi:MAG TPA: hypothetical protein VEL07_06135, partial [Planctomycetota bacterium]|nr:hypothetical protein [Planctomycetota bacterium]
MVTALRTQLGSRRGARLPRIAACLALLLVIGAVVAAEPPAELTLAEALRLAHTQGREKTFQDEELRLLAMSLRNVRRDYGPQPFGSVTAGVSGTTGGERSDDQTAVLGVAQGLPTGGQLSISSDTSRFHAIDVDSRTTGLTASITQPLLRGAGYAVWRETLTSAERNHLYALRSHEQFRRDLSLGVAQDYWSLQQQQNALEQYRAAVD